MNRKGPPEKIPKVITIEEARRIADATLESAERERRESFEEESREYLAMQSFNLYVVIETFYAEGFLHSDNIITAFNDEEVAREYIETIADIRLNIRKITWQKFLDDGKCFTFRKSNVEELKDVLFKWDGDEYKPFLNDKYYDEFITYTIKNLDLNREYTIEEIDEEQEK